MQNLTGGVRVISVTCLLIIACIARYVYFNVFVQLDTNKAFCFVFFWISKPLLTAFSRYSMQLFDAVMSRRILVQLHTS